MTSDVTPFVDVGPLRVRPSAVIGLRVYSCEPDRWLLAIWLAGGATTQVEFDTEAEATAARELLTEK